MRYDTANNIVTFEGTTRLLDNVVVEGDITPFQSNTFNLGNSTHRWKDIYLSTNSVVLGDTTLSSDGGLQIDGETAVTAPNDTITIGNVVANTLSGEGSNITGLTLSQVGGVGNIASVNLNGNGSQVLAGNGAWIVQSSGSPNSISDGTSSVAVTSSDGNVQITSNGVVMADFYNDRANLNGLVFANYLYSKQLTVDGPTTFSSGIVNLGTVNNLRIQNGNIGQVLTKSGNFGEVNWSTPSVSAAGANGQIQVNSNGAFAGYANLTWNDGLGQIAARRFSAALEVSTPQIFVDGIASGSRNMNINAGGSGIGSGNITISTGGNPATGGGNIRIQSGVGDATSNIFIGNSTQNAVSRSRTTITGDVVLNTPVPTTASSNGIAGQTAVGGGYIYVCVSANTWQRAALSTW
jgi:hypothetical protein